MAPPTAFLPPTPLPPPRHRTRALLSRRPPPARLARLARLAATTLPARPPTASAAPQTHPAVADPFLAARAGATCPAASWTSPRPAGAARIALSRNVDVPNIARSYGMILAKQMHALGVEHLIPEAIIDGIHLGWDEVDQPMDVASFEAMMQAMLGENGDGTEGAEGDEMRMSEMLNMSRMYGFLLGTTLRMSCLELPLALVIDGFRARCGEPELALPMDEGAYDRGFMELQQTAAALMHDANKGDADSFFASLVTASDIVRVSPSVSYLAGRRRAPESLRPVGKGDVAEVVMAGRLLDGRAFLVPNFSDGVEEEADAVAIPLAGVPESLACGIAGMREGEVRTVYIHPRASDGISALFSAQPFPPQTVIIFDFKLLRAKEADVVESAAAELVDE